MTKYLRDLVRIEPKHKNEVAIDLNIATILNEKPYDRQVMEIANYIINWYNVRNQSINEERLILTMVVAQKLHLRKRGQRRPLFNQTIKRVGGQYLIGLVSEVYKDFHNKPIYSLAYERLSGHPKRVRYIDRKTKDEFQLKKINTIRFLDNVLDVLYNEPTSTLKDVINDWVFEMYGHDNDVIVGTDDLHYQSIIELGG